MGHARTHHHLRRNSDGEWQTIGFSAGSIPTMPGCTVTVPITATAAGSYTITLAAGALATAKGTNASAATAALIAGSALTMAVAFRPPVWPQVSTAT